MSDYLKAEEMAATCGVSAGTARMWREKQMGPRWFKLPGTRRVLYAREDVDAWIEAARAASVGGDAA